MKEYNDEERTDNLIDRIEELEADTWIEWVCPECDVVNEDIYADTARPACSDCGLDFDWDEVLFEEDMKGLNRILEKIDELETKLRIQRCPICNTAFEIRPGWTLMDRQIAGHQVAYIGSGHNAGEHVRAVRFQIASNVAAYEFDADAWVDLGLFGKMWVQCPTVRDHISPICWAK